MNKIIHRAEERGHVNHGWLDANHSFSFAGWFNRNKMGFGRLRVLNDDTISPEAGFGLHPHDNMEIITIMLKGSLKHKDSMGNEGVISENEIQVMSAGSGIMHSEFNASNDKECNLLQIWIQPSKRDIEPKYDQINYSEKELTNNFVQLVGPANSKAILDIQQNAFISMSDLESGKMINYQLNEKSNGIYLFLISGQIQIDDESLNSRDAIGLWDIEKVEMMAENDSKVLIIEVPID